MSYYCRNCNRKMKIYPPTNYAHAECVCLICGLSFFPYSANDVEKLKKDNMIKEINDISLTSSTQKAHL